MGDPPSALLDPEIPILDNLDGAFLVFVINHLFLPPALPNESDRTPEHEASLIRIFKDCAETFAHHFEPQSNSRCAWDVITRMFAATALLHDRGTVEEDQLEKQIGDMGVGGEHSGPSTSKLI